jgi:hypothetical protein
MSVDEVPLGWWLPAIAAFAVFAGLYILIRVGGVERFPEWLQRVTWLALAAALAYLAFLYFYLEVENHKAKHPWNAVFFGVIAVVAAVAALRASPQSLRKMFEKAGTE